MADVLARAKGNCPVMLAHGARRRRRGGARAGEGFRVEVSDPLFSGLERSSASRWRSSGDDDSTTRRGPDRPHPGRARWAHAVERIVLMVLLETQAERRGKHVPMAMLYGRVMERVDMSRGADGHRAAADGAEGDVGTGAASEGRPGRRTARPCWPANPRGTPRFHDGTPTAPSPMDDERMTGRARPRRVILRPVHRTRRVRRARPARKTRDHPRLLRPALAAVGLLPDVLPAPVRRAQDVHDVQGVGAVLLPVHVRRQGRLPVAARLRDPPPDAPRLQRHAAGPALADELHERRDDDAGDEEAATTPSRTTARSPRRASPAGTRSGRRIDKLGAVVGRAPALGRGATRSCTSTSRRHAVDVRAPADALRDGAHPRRHRELVRAQLRLPELRERRRVHEHAGARLSRPPASCSRTTTTSSA